MENKGKESTGEQLVDEVGVYLHKYSPNMWKGNDRIRTSLFLQPSRMSRCGHLVSMAAKITESERTRYCVPQIVLPKNIMEMMTKLGGTLGYIKTTLALPERSNLGRIQSLDSAANFQEIQKTEEQVDLPWEYRISRI